MGLPGLEITQAFFPRERPFSGDVPGQEVWKTAGIPEPSGTGSSILPSKLFGAPYPRPSLPPHPPIKNIRLFLARSPGGRPGNCLMCPKQGFDPSLSCPHLASLPSQTQVETNFSLYNFCLLPVSPSQPLSPSHLTVSSVSLPSLKL